MLLTKLNNSTSSEHVRREALGVRGITKARKAQSVWRIAIKIKGSSQSTERKKLKDQVNEGMSLFQLWDPEKSHYVRTTHEMGAEGL
jgi:hypothetical protein